MDKIFVDNLKVNCIIGILPEERIQEQTLLVSLVLDCNIEKAGRTGDLSLSIDYAKLCMRLKEYIVNRKAKLLEELAVELCDLVLAEFKPSAVSIKLNKPEAISDASGVGIEITRNQAE